MVVNLILPQLNGVDLTDILMSAHILAMLWHTIHRMIGDVL